MDRRNFIVGVGTGIAAAVTSESLAAQPATTAQLAPDSSAVSGGFKLKLGCQSGPANDDHFAFLARYGVTNIAARSKTSEGRFWSTRDELLESRRR